MKTSVQVKQVIIVDVNEEKNDRMDKINKLKETFPNKGLEPCNDIRFADWKVNELKTFLDITGEKKGISKAKKEQIVIKVMKVWCVQRKTTL